MKAIYATSGWGRHDEWWLRILHKAGVSATPVSLGSVRASETVRALSTLQELTEFAAQVRRSSGGNCPVLAGPLQTVARPMLDLGLRVIGISWGWDLDENPADIYLPPFDNYWMRGLSGLVVDTEASAHAARCAGLDPGKLMTMVWGIDVRQFADTGPTIPRTDLRIPESATVVLSMRAHTRAHGVSDVLHALALSQGERDDLFLILAGEGILRKQHERLSSELGIQDRTRFLGNVPESALPALVRTSDCSVIASHTDGTPVSMLQSLACGVPVLTPDRPNYLAWQRFPTKYTYSSGNILDLADRITRINRLTKPSRELTLSQDSLARMDERQSISRLGNFLQDLIK